MIENAVVHSFKASDGARISFRIAGAGDPLALIHGGFVDAGIWDEVLSVLASDHAVYVLDRRGHGESHPYRADHRIEREYDDVAEWLNHIARPAVVVAHSSGAHIALHAALRTNFVAGLLLYEPPHMNASVSPEWIEQLQRANDVERVRMVMRDIVGRSTGRVPSDERFAALLDTKLGELLVRNAKALPVEVMSYAGYRPDWPKLRTLRRTTAMPITFLLGERSAPVYRAVIDEFRAALPDSALDMLPGQAHNAMLDAPEVFIAAVQRRT
jgi:pimeloyl-ACP methyl ester carboxylesterase